MAFEVLSALCHRLDCLRIRLEIVWRHVQVCAIPDALSTVNAKQGQIWNADSKVQASESKANARRQPQCRRAVQIAPESIVPEALIEEKIEVPVCNIWVWIRQLAPGFNKA